MAETYIVADQAFRFVVSGLRPQTTHYFLFENANNTADCAQSGKQKGTGLVSSNGGILDFTYYFSSGIAPSTDQRILADQYNRIAGIKKIRVQNSDNTSVAQDIITFVPYNTGTIDRPQPQPTPTDPIPIDQGGQAPNIFYV